MRAVGKRPSIAKVKEGKDFLGWLRKSGADIVCLQEIKAQMEQVPADLINPAGYFSFYNPAQKKGYSGVAVYTKQKPLKVANKMGFKRFDDEGRILRMDFKGFTLVNLYLPHGGRDKGNLGYKLKVYEYLLKYLRKSSPRLARRESRRAALPKGREKILIGDFNIAHSELDLARPKQNQKNIMFTPEERAQLDKLMKLGFVDAFRKAHPTEKKYTWWPYFANARARNLGWRIDYTFVSRKLAPKVKSAQILSNITGSDHCPISVEIK